MPQNAMTSGWIMKGSSVRFWLVFAAALVMGVLLHFAYDRFPNPVTALISPVRESLWEHLKILFLPLLLSGWFLGGRRGKTPWLCANLLVCGATLLLSWLYHVVLEGDALVFDLLLYAVMMLAGFLLPRVLWPLSEWPGVGAACAILTVLLAVLLIVFTYTPPAGILFADLSGGVRTFLTIPV